MKKKVKNGNSEKVVSEFKKFAMRGNILDLAAAVVIGTAFNKIVTSLANNILTPLASIWFGGVDLTEYKWVYKEAQLDASENIVSDAIVVYWGVFLQAIIEFIITALFVFLALKIILRIKKHIRNIEAVTRRELEEALRKLDDKFDGVDDKEKDKDKEADNKTEAIEAKESEKAEIKAEAAAEVKNEVEPKTEKTEVKTEKTEAEETNALLSEIRDLLLAQNKNNRNNGKGEA